MTTAEQARGTRTSLGPVERHLAALVTSTINGSSSHVRALADDLRRLGVASWVLDAVARAPGWPATDDDRLDVITMFAARLTRSPGSLAASDVARLRSVGLGDREILDLVNLVSTYNCVNRVTLGLGVR